MKHAVRMSLSSKALSMFVGAGALFLLAGCVSDQGGVGSGRISEAAVSQQTPNTEERQRAKIHTELGSLYLKDGRFQVAIEEARIALAADGNYAPAYSLLGLVHMFLGENKPAEDSFRRALSLASNDPEINNNFGWFLCQTGREQASMPYFQAAMRNNLYQAPTKPYTNAGICLLRLKDYKGAEEYLNTAVRYDPANTLAMYWLAEVYYKTDRLIEARIRVNELAKMLEPTPESSWLGVRVERKLGDREAELRHATQLRRKFQNSPEYQKLLQGQYE